MNLYENQFSAEHDFNNSIEVKKTLVIASTGRSGSHMLGHMLYDTGCFGYPLEYLNPSNLRRWKDVLNCSNTEQVVQKLKNKRTSDNGVFSIKVHYPHIANANGFADFLDLFQEPYFVLLTRRGVVKQAVSLSIASQTGEWISGQKAVCKEPNYNYRLIERCLRETILYNASWRYILELHGCRYINTDFEEIRSNPINSINSISQFMGVDLTGIELPSLPLTTKQSSHVNDLWVERFLNECDPHSELVSQIEPGFISKVINKFNSR